MSLTISNTNFAMKNAMNLPNLPLKRELLDTSEYNEDIDSKTIEHNDSDNSEISDLENNPSDETTKAALDFSEHHRDLIKKEFLLEFEFGSNLFRNQNLGFKNESFNGRSPFLLPTQLYKNFLANLGKRRRNVADWSLYPRNMLFPNGLGLDASDDENNGDRTTDSPDEVIFQIIGILTVLTLSE